MNEGAKTVVRLPGWAWAVFAGIGGFALLLLGGFFTWLGDTTVDQGREISALSTKIDYATKQLDGILKKLDSLPPNKIEVNAAEIQNLKVQVEELRKEMRQFAEILERGRPPP